MSIGDKTKRKSISNNFRNSSKESSKSHHASEYQCFIFCTFQRLARFNASLSITHLSTVQTQVLLDFLYCFICPKADFAHI
ncbi:hypothetical protein, partial [Acinetobacter venetianus]|uniref:hypothetical protein n=1 Tax=Acinetobacter venetianus TaxID=52133 RepID=UPI00214FEBE6